MSNWRNDPATDAQISLIQSQMCHLHYYRDLSKIREDVKTKGQASIALDRLNDLRMTGVWFASNDQIKSVFAGLGGRN